MMHDRFGRVVKAGDKILYPMSHGRLVECIVVCSCIVDFRPCVRFYAVNDPNKIHHVSILDKYGICRNIVRYPN